MARMANLETGYQPLESIQDNGDDTPQGTNVMVHVLPETNRARWNHVEDLDSFFSRVYEYHQRHGFRCIVIKGILELFQFASMVCIVTWVCKWVSLDLIWKGEIDDAFLPLNELPRFRFWECFLLFVSLIFWVLKAVKFFFNFFQFLEIKAFYNTALEINDSELDNLSWHEVQRKLQEVQRQQQMCIHKQELTELDIYHRILRFKNYFVAMINKRLLPIYFKVPLIPGDMVFLSKGLKYNFELILFWGPWAPFENSWHLREDYKKSAKRRELAEALSKTILWYSVANLLLAPLILIWQILFTCFNYLEVFRREPGAFGSRRWSLYGRTYLRHFNELDHELTARINRGYRGAKKYMDMFSSHELAIIAKTVMFVCGAALAVCGLFTWLNEEFLHVKHFLQGVTLLGITVGVCRAFIPDENLVWCPERLMMNILAHIHYMPDHWNGNAHTHQVRAEFSQLFRYTAVRILEEVLSPIITPIILFRLRHKALDIVDFFRNFTIEVVGVGDVCSFAQMDVRKHGASQWMNQVAANQDQYQQAEDGKTELSLMHFRLTNPKWKPPEQSMMFLNSLHQHAQRDLDTVHVNGSQYLDNALSTSLHSVSSMGAEYSGLINNLIRRNPDLRTPGVMPSFFKTDRPPEPPFQGAGPKKSVIKGLTRSEGPPQGSGTGILSSLHAANTGSPLTSQHVDSAEEGHVDSVPLEVTTADMSFSALYMHELHRRQIQQRANESRVWGRPVESGMSYIQESPQEDEEKDERKPLLEQRLIRKQ